MLLSKTVKIILNGRNIKYYKNLGYSIPQIESSESTFKRFGERYISKIGSEIEVKVEDLSDGSNTLVKVKCDCCDKEYEMKYVTYKTHNYDGQIYCRKCANKVFHSGQNNANWKSEKTQEERENGRNYPEYIEFIKKVLSRDDYTCQCCGKNSNGDIKVHHLDGYNWCKEKRTDVTNGVSLCENCHSNFHLKYGRGNNTKDQFEEWIGHTVKLLEYGGELYTTKKVYCIEEDKIYDSAEILAKEWNIVSTNIYDVCNCKRYGTVLEKHLLWYEKYIKMSKDDIYKYFKLCEPKNIKPVICITTNKVFNLLKEAGEFYNIKSYQHINSCCNKQRKYCGKLEDGTKLEWEYYNTIS